MQFFRFKIIPAHARSYFYHYIQTFAWTFPSEKVRFVWSSELTIQYDIMHNGYNTHPTTMRCW